MIFQTAQAEAIYMGAGIEKGTEAVGNAVMAVLSMCPALARGEPEKARDNALRVFKSVFISQTVGLFVRSCLWMTPLAPFAEILGMGAGMASSLLLSDVDVVKMLKKIAKEAQQRKPKAISA